MSTSVSVQLLDSLFDGVFFGLDVIVNAKRWCLLFPANSGPRELELQNMRFAEGGILAEMELWSGPSGMVLVFTTGNRSKSVLAT